MNHSFTSHVLCFASKDHIYLADMKPVYNCIQPKVLGLFLLKDSVLALSDVLADLESEEEDEYIFTFVNIYILERSQSK